MVQVVRDVLFLPLCEHSLWSFDGKEILRILELVACLCFVPLEACCALLSTRRKVFFTVVRKVCLLDGRSFLRLKMPQITACFSGAISSGA